MDLWGECLRCALRLALADGSDANESPQDDGSPAPVPPRLRYSHFEVALGVDGEPAELGSGAMATTYRALDTTLHLPVALKVINGRAAGHPAARARFLREARAAACLHHPNVASVTFYGEQEGECFYAMELVEGETLAERVRRLGPLKPEQAVEIGVQVAQALTAAEACGVTHRDLKPSNLMLVDGLSAQASRGQTGDLHVKVIDWGLAKTVNAQDAPLPGDHQTRDAFVGTPAFASPEQFASGAGRRVDTRSDIYRLGVTLWFLLCGKAPFVGDTLEAIHARQQILPTEQLKAAKVPASLIAVLIRMLAFDPAARPQSARELLDLLRVGQTPRRGGKRWVVKRQTLAWMLVAAAAVVGTLAAGAWWRQRPPGRGAPAAVAAEKPAVAVLPFENGGTNEADAFFTTGAQDEITDDLAYAAALRVVDADSTRSYLPGRCDLSKVGAELGVRYLLEGRVRRDGNQVEISVRLVDLRQPQHPWGAQCTRQIGEVFSMPGEITRAVADRLRVILSDKERATIDRPPTTSLAAYDLHLKVHGQMPLLQSYQERDHYYREIVVPALESAVTLDPDFAFAYCDLAEAYGNLAAYKAGRDQAEAAAKHRAQVETVLSKARNLRPDAGQVHLAQAIHLVDFPGNNELVGHELELARRALPNNATVEHAMGVLAQKQSRWDEAVACFERALSLEPRNITRRWNPALEPGGAPPPIAALRGGGPRTCTGHRRHAGFGVEEEAVHEAKHACKMGMGGTAGQYTPLMVCNLAIVYAWTGQFDLACETLEPWIGRPAGQVWPMQPTYGDFSLNPV